MTKIAYIFPGQGAFFTGALRDARLVDRRIEGVLTIAEGVARRRFGRSLLRAIWDEANDTAHLMKSDPALLQLAIYAVSVAAHEMLRDRGIGPDVLMGHSFGEIAALACADAFSIEQGAEIVCDRTEVLAEAAPADGCMAAISADSGTVNTMIAAWMQTRPATPAAVRVVVAVENHDQQTVVSGPEREIIAFMAACKGKLSAHRLNSPYGFHHPALAPAGAAFAARLRSRPIAHPRRPVYSPIMGRYYRPDDNIAECLARHLVMPVAFSSAVRRLGADNVAVFIECGGLDGLTKIIRRIHGRSGATAFATFMPNAAYDSGVAPIVDHIKGIRSMNAQVSPSFVDFEAFWKERSPFIMALIRAEFVSFLLLQHQQVRWSPAEMSLPALPVPPGPEPAARQPAAPVAIRQPEQRSSASAARVGRDRLFKELVAIYAEAMEYPPEVFTETVELEAELGIDSVKQTEIMGRLGELYGLPPMPANVRISDFKTMGAVVDLVFANQGKAAVAA